MTLSDEYFSLALVSLLATLVIIVCSQFFKRCVIYINIVLIIAVTCALILYSWLLGETLWGTFKQLMQMVIGDGTTRMTMVAFWIFNVAISIIFCTYITNLGYSTTRHRKFFHLTVSLIYMSGIHLDIRFTWLCGWLCLCIFILIELLRYYNVPPAGSILNSNLLIFKDAQDSTLLLTPIYLLIGIFEPLFLSAGLTSARNVNIELALFAGVASVGVGDSFAAIIGSKFGRNKWPQSHKSIEGSAAMCVSMFIFLLFVQQFLKIETSIFSIFISSFVAAAVEAFINNCDNILLPFITFFILKLPL